MIKDYQSFNYRHIFIKMVNHLLIILMMADSNHPQMENLGFMVLIVDDHIRMFMSNLNNKDYLPPVIELEDDKN